jgi:hypothetical protein
MRLGIVTAISKLLDRYFKHLKRLCQEDERFLNSSNATNRIQKDDL